MRLINALTRTVKRIRVYLFGANITIVKQIHVSGPPREKRLQIDVAHQEMRKEAAHLLGIEHYEFSVGPEQCIGATSIHAGMWLGTKRRVYSILKNHITGTFYCRSFYNTPLGSDDGRRKLRLEVNAKGLLPWGPFLH